MYRYIRAFFACLHCPSLCVFYAEGWLVFIYLTCCGIGSAHVRDSHGFVFFHLRSLEHVVSTYCFCLIPNGRR